MRCLAAALALLLLPPNSATLTLDVFPNTVLAPLSAATRSYPSTVSLSHPLASFSSARFTGMVTSPFTQSLNFSAACEPTDQLRVWVDNHILLDCSAQREGSTCLSSASLPVMAGTPVQLRVELTHGAGDGKNSTTPLALFWQGNATALSEVPASAFSPSVPSWETSRVAMRDRLQNPGVAWQTWTQNMAAHVLMPQGLALDATLRNLATGEELGNIVPWRSFDPANVRPGIHSLNGSDYTQFTLSRWGSLNCSVDFSSTVVGEGGDLVWLVESTGEDCGGLAVVFRALVKWGYSGFFVPTSNSTFTAVLPGFPNVSVGLVGGSPLGLGGEGGGQGAPTAPCNLTGTWCCSETSVVEDGAGGVTSVAGYGTGVGTITPSGNVSMYFTNEPTSHFFGYVEGPACDTVHWLNDGSTWKRGAAPPAPPFSPFQARLGQGPIVVATGATAATLNVTSPSVAQALVAEAAGRADAWLDAGEPGLRDAFEPLSAVLLWDTIFTPYLSPVTASSRLWVCTGNTPNCEQTGYVLFNWDMPMCAWTWGGLGNAGFPKDMAYAQLIEDAYTRTLMGFVPGYSSGTFASGDRTQPPLFAFVAMQLYGQYGEAWLLEALFDPLWTYLDFLWNYRRGGGVFAEGSSDGHVALFGWGSNNFTGGDDAGCTKRGAGYESGLDDSPMWDEAGWLPCGGGAAAASNGGEDPGGLMMLYDAGLTGLFLSEATALIAMAGVIGGKQAQVALLQARFNATATAMNAHLWNGTRGIYQNVLWDGTPSIHLSPTSYYPLMAGPASGAVPKERAQAMVATLASPLGMCLNASGAHGPGGPFATPLSRWAKAGAAAGAGAAVDTATCASQACLTELVILQYPLTPTASLGAVVLNTSAPSAHLLTPLANWYSAERGDTALTNSTSTPPHGDPSYTLLRLEGYCLPTQDAPPSPTTPITTWRLGNDTAACSSPLCEEDMGTRGYTLQGTLCYGFAVGGVGDYPCTFGAPSISRDDPQFDAGEGGTGLYWRGRIWPATEGTLYWAIMGWGEVVPDLGLVRQALASKARALANFHWSAWGAVCENAHAILGTCAEMVRQGKPGFDDPLLNWSGIGPFLSIFSRRKFGVEA